MARIMDQLREEHKNVARLLAVLERQLDLFDRAEHPDYDMLSAIAAYFVGFPEQVHHPKEDLVLARMREVSPKAAAEVGDLESEHERIGVQATVFRDAVTNVLHDAEMPRVAFHTVVRDFIAEQRKHMQMEETRFFPAAEKALGPADWEALDADAARVPDPLFGPKGSREFAKVYADIVAWEEEDKAAAK